jgi:hypothetical protein
MKRIILRAAVLGVALCISPVPAEAGPFRLMQPPTAAELKLSHAQQQEWEALQADARALRRQLLADLETSLPELEAALAEPEADLGLLSQHVQSQVLFALWQTQAIRQRRLAFYESLAPDQQARVRAWLVDVVRGVERLIAAARVLQAP